MNAGRLTRLDGSRCNLTTLSIWTMEILRIEAVGHTRWMGFHKFFFSSTPGSAARTKTCSRGGNTGLYIGGTGEGGAR